MEKNKQILAILIPGFPGSEEDTTCLPAQQSFILHLQRSMPEIKIVVLSFHYPFHQQPYLWNGITVFPFSGMNKGGIRGYFMRRKVDSVLRQLNQENGIKTVLSFWYGECAFAGQIFSKKSGVPHYCWIRGQDARAENHYPSRLKMKSAHLIALSDFLQDEFERNHAVRPGIKIPQGIDANNFIVKEQERDIDLLAAGSLIPLKRMELFIETVKAVKEKRPAVKAVIVGKGPEKERLEKMVEEMGLTDSLSFTGELSYTQVIQYMQRTKILLHPSSYEGFSGVCLEALAAGARVISFCRAMKEEIKNWSIVDGIEGMKMKTIQLLNDQIQFSPVIPFKIEETVSKMKKILE